MKKIGFGISVLLAGILFELAIGGLDYLCWIFIGLGLVFCAAGLCEKEPS